MRLFFGIAVLSSLFVMGCVEGPATADTTVDDSVNNEKQLSEVSLIIHEMIARGEVIENPFDDSGVEPYVFVSAEKRDEFYRMLDEAELTVPVALHTSAEVRELAGGEDGASAKAAGTPEAQSSCGPGCVYQTVGYCEGALLDGQINNLGAKYGAYTYAFNYITGSMVPFSAELKLPYTSSTLGDYNFDYNSPRELYIEQLSNLTSANRSRHRCCYWFWGIPSWTLQCSPYFDNQL